MNPTGQRAGRAAGAAASAALEPRDPSPAELGRRIKMLRVSRGLTLKDLEERGGISATHVSEIERGKASPTVGALGRIALALGMRPASLVEPHELPEMAVSRAGERKRHTLQWGRATLERLSPPIQNAEVCAHLLRLPVAREPALAHHHEGEEWVMAISGVAEIRVGEQSFVLREGDTLHFRAHVDHAYSNLTSAPAVLMMAGRPQLTV